MKTINLSELRTRICTKSNDCPAYGCGCPFQKLCTDIRVQDWINKPIPNLKLFVHIMEFRRDEEFNWEDFK